MTRQAELLERLREQTDDCLIWRGALYGRMGYGYVRWNGQSATVHRIAFELAHGPIPADRVIHHECATPACFNPRHLRAVTHRENILLGSGLAARNAVKTHCPRGHEYTPENTYVTYARRRHGERKCRSCWRQERIA